MKSDFRFHHDIRVRFADTDLQGIVFNGNYLTYYDVAWTEYFRAVGFEWRDLLALGVDTVLARSAMVFKSPARFDEILQVHTRVSKIGTARFTTRRLRLSLICLRPVNREAQTIGLCATGKSPVLFINRKFD